MKLIFLSCLLFIYSTVFAQWQTDTLPPSTPLIDPNNHWDTASAKELINAAYSFTDSTGYALYFITVDSTKQEIADFGNTLFKQWKMNEVFNEKGIILIYAYKARGIRLVYSKPVKTLLGETFTKDLLSVTIIPRLKEKKEKLAFLNAIKLLQTKIVNNKTR